MRKNYRAFVSYKHHAGLPFAERIAKSLRTYARYRLRPPLRVFRDEEYLLPNESLPNAIRDALEDSRFLVLLASREAASSVWVADELRIWCAELQRAKRLLIVLTEGDIVFDPATKRIDWASTTALPPVLAEHVTEIPLYVDLRWVDNERQLDLSNAIFKKEINRLCAALNEVDPERMFNTEVIVHRRNVWLARGATAALAAFAAMAAIGFVGERRARERAEAETQAAAANLLATRARQAGVESPQLGVLLAAEAARRLQARNQPVTVAVGQTLIDLFKRISGIGLRGHRVDRLPDWRGEKTEGTFVSAVAISPDSKWIATGDGDGRVLLRRRSQPDAWVELLHGTPTSFLAHDQEIQALEFSADSTRVSVSKFGDVRVWDIAGPPKEIARCAVDATFVYGAHFAGGGRWLITTSQAGIRVCDSQAPSVLGPLLAESDGVYRATLASGGELVVSARGHVWRWRDGTLVRKLPGFDGSYFSMAASPKGDRVAVGTTEGKVHAWRLDTGAHEVFDLGGLIGSVAFSPDGNSLAAASSNRTARIWDLTGQNEPLTFEHPDEVRTIAFHPTGQSVATVGRDRRVRLWSTYWLYTSNPVVLDGLTGDGGGDQLAFSADGSFLVGSGFEPIARLWPLNGLNPGVQVFRGSHYGAYESLAANPAAHRIAAVTRISGPDVWNVDHPDAPPTALPEARNNAFQVALSPDGHWLATSGVGTGSYLWNLASPSQAPRALLPATGYHNKVAFSPDSSLVAGMHQDGGIVLESTADPARKPTTLAANGKPAVDFAFDPAGTHVAAAYPDGSAFVWDVRAATKAPLAAAGARRDATMVAFAPDGRHVALAGSAFVDWTDLSGGSSRRLAVPQGLALTRIAIAPDSVLVAAGTRNGPSLVWDASGNDPPRILAGQVKEVLDIAFAPDGKSLASATQDAIRVWSVRDLDATPLRLDVKDVRAFTAATSDTSTSISSLIFLDGRQVAAATGSHLVVVWNLDWADLVARACETAGRSLSAGEIADHLDGTPASACLPEPKQR